MRRSIMVVCLLISGCNGTIRMDDDEWFEPGEYHAQALKNGDLRRRSLSAVPMPYHLTQVLEWKRGAGPVLLEMLNDDRRTGYTWIVGRVLFSGSCTYTRKQGEGFPIARKATMGELADYALQHIYGTNVEYSSTLPRVEKAAAIANWRRIVREAEEAQDPLSQPLEDSETPLLDGSQSGGTNGWSDGAEGDLDEYERALGSMGSSLETGVDYRVYCPKSHPRGLGSRSYSSY